MIEPLIVLSIAYAAVAALLLNLCIRSRWPAWVKAGAIVLTGSLYYFTYGALHGFLGWPAQEQPPERFQLVGAVVEEGDKNTGRPGWIYLWTLPLEDDRAGAAPRAYRVPYTEALHRQVGEAERQLRRGVVQLGEVQTITAPPRAGPTKTQQSRTSITLYDLPSPELPEK